MSMQYREGDTHTIYGVYEWIPLAALARLAWLAGLG